MKRFNDWLGLKITSLVSTMWCAYLFAVIAFVGYPYGSHDPRAIIQWCAQEFLQLVLLSIILVGQRLQTEQQTKNHKAIKEIHKHLGIKE